MPKNLKSAEAKHLPDSLIGVLVLNGGIPNGRLLPTVVCKSPSTESGKYTQRADLRAVYVTVQEELGSWPQGAV